MKSAIRRGPSGVRYLDCEACEADVVPLFVSPMRNRVSQTQSDDLDSSGKAECQPKTVQQPQSKLNFNFKPQLGAKKKKKTFLIIRIN